MLGKPDPLRPTIQRRIRVLEANLRKCPEDARAPSLLAAAFVDYDLSRAADALREADAGALATIRMNSFYDIVLAL